MYIIDGREKLRSLNRILAMTGALSARSQNLRLLAENFGYSIVDADHIAQKGTPQENLPGIDLLIVDLTSIPDRPVQEMSNISAYLQASGAEALICTDMENLETAYANFPVSQCHFLVDGSDMEALLIISGAIRRGKKMDQLHDNSRDVEFGALYKISDELADFARKLARIAEQEDLNGAPKLAENPVSFRPAPTAAMQPFVQPFVEQRRYSHAGMPPPVDARLIREIIKLRRRREAFFDAELLADPAWDILLDLLAARLEGKSVSVSSLCIAAAVPATTALRWITGMTESGMLVRRQDPTDARRVFIELSEADAEKMLEYFAEFRKVNIVAI